jgi:YggT family protein
MGSAIVFLVDSILGLIVLAVIVQAILSWLIAFDVVNPRSQFVSQVLRFLDAVIGPLLAPFQRIVPPLGGVDITPILLILALQAVRIAFDRLAAPALINLLG